MNFKDLIDRFGHACYANDNDDLIIETSRALEDAIDVLIAERDALREVCAEAYQFAGAYDAPEAVLDKLFVVANGDEIPEESYLPIETTTRKPLNVVKVATEFNKFVANYDTYSDEWQNLDPFEVFDAGFRAAEKSHGIE